MEIIALNEVKKNQDRKISHGLFHIWVLTLSVFIWSGVLIQVLRLVKSHRRKDNFPGKSLSGVT